METWEFNEIAYAYIISRAWLSEDFKEHLLKDPKAVLKANGFTLPRKAQVKIEQGTKKSTWIPKTRTLIVPYFEPPNDLLVKKLSTTDLTDLPDLIGLDQFPVCWLCWWRENDRYISE